MKKINIQGLHYEPTKGDKLDELSFKLAGNFPGGNYSPRNRQEAREIIEGIIDLIVGTNGRS